MDNQKKSPMKKCGEAMAAAIRFMYKRAEQDNPEPENNDGPCPVWPTPSPLHCGHAHTNRGIYRVNFDPTGQAIKFECHHCYLLFIEEIKTYYEEYFPQRPL